jgi:hypothetical protein
MDAIPSDILVLVLLELDVASILSLSQTCTTLNTDCESSWARLFASRYGRYHSHDSKRAYIHAALSTGTVVRYTLQTGHREELPIRAVKKYVVSGQIEACINVFDECVCNGFVRTDVVDISISRGFLYVLTTGALECYDLRHGRSSLVKSLPLVQGKRILGPKTCEMEDGRVLVYHKDGEKWHDCTTKFVRHLAFRVDGKEVRLTVPRYNVIDNVSGLNAILHERLYVVRFLREGRAIYSLPIHAKYGCIAGDDIVLVTYGGEVVRCCWKQLPRKTYKVEDGNVLVRPIWLSTIYAYYIRREL